ncbi:MAG: ral secretion pathway protein [Proteobacteria bacterium]|nr:ral secretion pathway protein [Pseudomonadota bacterium]
MSINPFSCLTGSGRRAALSDRCRDDWMNRFSRHCVFGALIFCTAFSATAEEKVTLNFVNADIDAVIKAISQISGRNFLIDPRVKGTINIVSASPIPTSATYDVLLSALRVNGFTAVESDGVTKVVPEAEGKLQGGALVRKGKAQGDQVLTQIFPLRYESANMLMPLVRPLVSQNGSVMATPAFNALVVTDYGNNLRRMEKLIAEIDRPNASVPYVIPIRYASVVDVNHTLNKLFADSVASGTGDKMQRVTIVPDLRSNSLIIRSDNAMYLERIRSLIQSLDQKTEAGGNIHLIYLKNAEATRVAQTLRAVLSGDTSAASATSASSSGMATTTLPGTNSTATQAPVQGGIIHADAASNSLIITAPESVYNNLRFIIDKLDFRRAQVHVEALIVEVTSDKAAEFGFQWQSLSGANDSGTNTIGGTNFGTRGTGTNIIDAAANIGSVSTGLNIGILRGKITLPGIGTILNLGMLARAMESDSNANILSTPNLMTLDNEEAKIVIGQNVPFITGQYAQTGNTTTATPFQTIERKDVGLTLRIKPQISEGGSVKLQIFQEVSSIQDKTNVAGIITNKRSIESTVIVDDSQIIALGGLIQDSVTESLDKVPFLGDIPVIGNLFKTESRKRTKTNLMVFLRPTIMRDAKSYADITDQRYRHIMGEQSKAIPRSHFILPDMDGPKMLPLPSSPSQPAER